jgi:hypothetical protein
MDAKEKPEGVSTAPLSRDRVSFGIEAEDADVTADASPCGI